MKILAYVSLIIIAAIAFWGGTFFVGNYFLTKNHAYHDAKAANDAHGEASRRTERVAFAKSANKDDFQIKKLKEELKRKKYEKRTGYNDLSKKIKKAKTGLTIWYLSEEDEDLGQIKNYAVYYKGKREELRKKADEYKAEIEAFECEEETLGLSIEKLTQRHEEVLKRSEALSQRVNQDIAAYEDAKREYLGTPVFRRKSLEKSLKMRERILHQNQKKINEMVQVVETCQNDILQTEERLSFLREELDEIKKHFWGTLEDESICREAEQLTASALENTKDIRELKAEILRVESQREDKRIEVQIQ